MSKLRECGDEATAITEELIGKYDVRIVLGVLGARFAEVAAAAMSAGVDRKFVLEVLVGTLDCALTPPKKPSTIIYMNGDEHLGRKH